MQEGPSCGLCAACIFSMRSLEFPPTVHRRVRRTADSKPPLRSSVCIYLCARAKTCGLVTWIRWEHASCAVQCPAYVLILFLATRATWFKEWKSQMVHHFGPESQQHCQFYTITQCYSEDELFRLRWSPDFFFFFNLVSPWGWHLWFWVKSFKLLNRLPWNLAQISMPLPP